MFQRIQKGKMFTVGQLIVAGALILTACTAPKTGQPASTTSPVAALATSETAATEPEQNLLLTATEQIPLTPTATPAYPRPAFPIAGIELNGMAKSRLVVSAQVGAYWIRRNALLWMDIEPQEGDRKWEAAADLEQELRDAAALHLQVILVVRGTPQWAQKTPGMLCSAVSVNKLEAFARFMADAVERYSQSPYNVIYWELFNEPDVDPSLVPSDYPFGCWGDNYDPYYGGGHYGEMLRQAYPAMKSANSGIQVLSGGLNLDCDPENPPQGKDCLPARYLQGILEQGGGDFLDGVSFHSYDYYGGSFLYSNFNWKTSNTTNGPAIVAKARFLRQVLDSYGFEDKYLINTEMGILCGRDKPDPHCQTEEFNLTKAYYAVQVNAAAMAAGLRGTIWYTLRGWRSSALVTSDLSPLPVYHAYRFSTVMLNGSAFVRYLDEYPGVAGYEFYRDGKYWWLLWDLDGTGQTIQLPTTPSSANDVFGQEVAPASEMVITQAPLYLEWEP